MSWVSAILGLLSVAPDIINMIKSLMTWLNKISGNNPAGIINQWSEAFVKLNSANTSQEKSDAAKNMADLVNSLFNK